MVAIKSGESFGAHTGLNVRMCILLISSFIFVGQGRFCTVIRSGSRGAQGILLVYDIANKWSFDGIPRWLDEVNKYAPGIPKVLIGNRLHMAFNRQVC